jgi:hypothetical protein
MITMTELQLDDHIKSNKWDFVETIVSGSESYKSQIGILRVLFGIQSDPSHIVTLVSPNNTELWVSEDNNNYTRLFG